MRSSRRLLAVLLALAAFAAPAALARPAVKCAEGAEKAGCKLPVNATYAKRMKVGSSEASVTVTVASSSFGTNIYAAPITCTKFAPLLGKDQQAAVNLRIKARPVVGKTYTYKDTERRSEAEEGGGVSSTEENLTVVFKSATQALVTLHQVSSADGVVQCDGTGTWTLERQ